MAALRFFYTSDAALDAAIERASEVACRITELEYELTGLDPIDFRSGLPRMQLEERGAKVREMLELMELWPSMKADMDDCIRRLEERGFKKAMGEHNFEFRGGGEESSIVVDSHLRLL